MTRLLPLFYLPLVLLILPVSLHAQWAEVPGYDRRDILKMDTFQKRIFMLEDRGILYRSDNHGLSWKALKPGGTAMAQVECFAGAGNTLVAYSGTGIWRSEDLGDSWAFVLPASPSLPPQFTSLVSLNGQFYLSRTSGIMRIDLDAKQLVTLYNIAASQVRLFVSGNDIWATATQNTVHRSTDSGQTWVKYPGLFVGELAFLGDTVWALSGASKAVFLLKSDPAQQLHERALPAASANASYRRLTAVNGKLYFSYVGQADVYVPATQGWQSVIPYWKNMRVNAIWSDGSFLFGLTTKGPARQNPVTGTWNLCNTGILFTEIPSFLQTGRYLFMYDDFGTGSPGGVLLPGPSPLWVTPHLLTTVSVSQTGNGYYAWDDSSRFWRSDPLLQEWTPVSTGPQLLSPYYYGRVFGQGDTLYASRSDARLFRSLNGGQDWSLYCGLPSGAKWEQLLLTEGKEAYYIDEFKQVYSLNTKYNQGLWDKQGIVTGPGRKLAKEGSTLYAATPSGKISLSGDQGLTWTTWDVVSQSGVTISYRDFEVCEAGIFVIASNTAPPGQVYPGLFYAAEAGDKFERLSFPPFDTLVLGPETNKLSSIKYVDGYLYVSMSEGQIYRQAFKPGQVYAYSGTIWQDDNDNGQQDAGEKPLANVLVRRGNFRFAITDAQGRYTLLDDLDPDTLRVAAPWKNWKVTPRFYAPAPPGNNFNFAFRPPNYRDFSIEQSLYPVLKPGKWSFVQLHWQNKSKANDATIRWVPPLDKLSIVEFQTTPDQFSGDTVIWNLPTMPAWSEGDIYIAVETRTNQPPGAPVFFWAEISPVAADDAPEDNVDTATAVVYAAFDPNDKQVEPAVYTTGDLARGRPLTYQVRFQNTGNYPASLVYIRDTLDAGLDLNTLELVSASHPCRWSFIGERVIEFLFDPIDLPDSSSNEPASHGFVKYRVQPLATLGPGDLIRNTAYIYFDFNAPVQTNTVGTLITIPTVPTVEVALASLQAYPNPAGGYILVQAPETLTQLEMFNVSGDRVLHYSFPKGNGETRVRLDLGALPPGVYTLYGLLENGVKAHGTVVRL